MLEELVQKELGHGAEEARRRADRCPPRQIEVELANHKNIGQACEEAGITQQTYYGWRKEYGGLKVEQGAPAESDGERERSPAPTDDRVVAGEASPEEVGQQEAGAACDSERSHLPYLCRSIASSCCYTFQRSFLLKGFS